MTDHDSEQIPVMPTIPAPSTWIIRREDITRWTSEGPVIETITLTAHIVEMNAAGTVVRFLLLYIDPESGPARRTVRTFMKPENAWLEYEEILPEPSLIVNPSSIIM